MVTGVEPTKDTAAEDAFLRRQIQIRHVMRDGLAHDSERLQEPQSLVQLAALLLAEPPREVRKACLWHVLLEQMKVQTLADAIRPAHCADRCKHARLALRREPKYGVGQASCIVQACTIIVCQAMHDGIVVLLASRPCKQSSRAQRCGSRACRGTPAE